MSQISLKAMLELVDKATKPLKEIMGESDKTSRALKTQREELKKLNQAQSNIASYRRMNSALKTTRQEITAAQAAVTHLALEHARVQNPTRAMTKAFEQAKQTVKQLKQTEQDQMRQLSMLKQGLSQAGISTKSLSRDERELRTRVESATTALQKKKNMLDKVSQSQQKLKELQAQFSSGAMKVAGVGMSAYAGARFLAPGTSLDQNMSKVQALARLDKNSPQLKMLREQAMKLGSETSFTAADAAAGQAFLAMAGFTPESIKAAMPSLLNIAKAGDLDLGTAADITSNILGGFGLDADKTESVADILTKAFTTSNTTLGMLGETMKYVAPVAKAAGMSLEEAATMAGLLGNVGIQSTQAGTTLRAMTLRLSAPPTAAAKALQKLGIETKDATGKLRNIPQIMSDVAKATENMGSGDRLEYLKNIFGTESASGMAELLEKSGSGAFDKYLDVIRDYKGTAAEVSKVMSNNVAGDWTVLISGFDGLRTSIYDIVKDDLRILLQGITNVISRFNEFAQANPQLVSIIAKVIIVVMAIVAAMGALTMAMVTVLAPLAILKLSFATLGLKSIGFLNIIKMIGPAFMWLGKALLMVGRFMLANPVILAITLLATAAYLIYKNWGPIKEFLANIWSSISAGAANVWQSVTGFFNSGIENISATILNWSPIGLFYRAFAAVMSWFGVQLPSTFTGFGQMLMQGLANGITGAVSWVVDKAKAAAAAVVNSVKNFFGIHSPSRVFAELGAYNMQGLALGIDQNSNLPSIAATSASQDMLGVFDTSAFTFDKRPAISGMSPAIAGSTATPMHVEINIYPTAGMDEHAIAQMVASEVSKIQRFPQTSGVRSYTDQD
ncbi:phage tail tape measure protein [Acinetobacter sp. WZC-1]|uniref:phage tail tape measure protein n=1 Tax=Acinetobacter sp. WZC-1 TaxID=3459034 RepID=UPI00403D6888